MKSGIYVLIILSVLSGCSRREAQPPTEVATAPNDVVLTDEQAKSANIQTGRIEYRNMSGSIHANGILDVPPQNLVTVSAPMGGFVKNTEILQGMKVQQGQVLVTLEHPDYIQLQQDYLDSNSQLEFLDHEYKRQEDLAKENVNAVKALELAKANYWSMKAKVQGLGAKLQLINIRPDDLERGTISGTISLYAPITGYVTGVNINRGMHVNPADEMFHIVDNSHLHAEAQVYETDIAKLKVGQLVRFRLTKDLRERTAKVYLIGKEITPERTVRVHCHLDQEDPLLIPGMYFSAVIETGDVSTSALPDAAVINFESKDFVFITKPGAHHYEMVEVRKGTSEGGFTEVTLPSQISADAEVVTEGSYTLLSFLKNKAE